MNRSIVINREFGSGGREIGRIISERTGMVRYDTRVLQEAASKRGLSPDLLADFDERAVSGPYFDLSIMGSLDPQLYSLPYRMYGAIADVITEAARVEPAVFIGRCADKILRDARLRFRSVFIYSTDTKRKIARAVAQLSTGSGYFGIRRCARRDPAIGAPPGLRALVGA